MWAVDGILLLLAYGDLLSKAFPSTEELLKKLAFLSFLPWYWKIIIILGANILLIGEGAFLAIRRREGQRDSYSLKLREIEDAKPNIILREPGAESVEQVTRRAGVNVLATSPFIKVRFVNSPTARYPNSIAHAVIARVKFYDVAGTLLLDMAGRWADSDQPSIRDSRESRNDLLRMEFGIEDEHSLDIAFRDTNGEFVAWNNDNYNFPDMKKPEHVLPGSHFTVEVRLSAVWIDKTF